MYKQIRNADNKFICEVNEKSREVIIKLKDCKTIIRFTPNGSIEIENSKPT